MTQMTRLFDIPSQAQAAFDDLKQRRFEQVELLLPTGIRERRPGDDLIARLQRAGIDSARAEACADAVRRGSAVVAVRAPFGSAKLAAAILDRHAPDASPQPVSTPPRASGDTESPSRPTAARRSSGPKTLSQMLGIPELIASNTFFSGFPLLIRSRPLPSPRRQVPDSSRPAKQTATRIDDPAPASNWLGLPVLSKNRDPKQQK
jgi:hypothetical protein